MLTNFTDEAQREIYIKKNATRLRNTLKRSGLTVDDIKDKDIDELIELKGVGEKCKPILEKMKELLKERDPA